MDKIESAPEPGTREDLDIDHEQFMGEEIPDPWDDDEQTDWENHPQMTDVEEDD